MSQQKVERNKALKANRKKINAQKRLNNIIAGVCTGAVAVALVIWIGVSAITAGGNAEGGETAAPKLPLNITALTEYMSGLSD